MSRNRGRHGSNRFPRPPERSAGVAPLLPLAPIQAERVAELRLAHAFAALLLFHWRGRVDPAIGARVSWALPALSKAQRRELSEDIELYESEGGDDCTSPAMLEAATRWFVGLRLPGTRLELWSGPPVHEHRQS